MCTMRSEEKKNKREVYEFCVHRPGTQTRFKLKWNLVTPTKRNEWICAALLIHSGEAAWCRLHGFCVIGIKLTQSQVHHSL